MSNIDTVEESVRLLRLIHETMVRERDLAWLPGIEACIQDGEAGIRKVKSASAALESMRVTYRAMHTGPGSFGDFFVWRDSEEERQRESEKMHEITDRLWSLLGSRAASKGFEHL